MTRKWTKDEAAAWYGQQPWLVGCNFCPSTAGNQMEFWSAESFDPGTIQRELDMAAGLGMNALRVFLHDLAWQADPDGFMARLEQFLCWSAERGLRVMPVLFDDCWFDPARLGPAPQPKPGRHNSIWLQSPGNTAVNDPAQLDRLEIYVKTIVSRHAGDERILLWDVYNELGNYFLPILSLPGLVRQARLLVRGLAYYLLPPPSTSLFRLVLVWIRSCDPIQPLTAALYLDNKKLRAMLAAESDVVSFHNYSGPSALRAEIDSLSAALGRPLLCTEYLARPEGSSFASSLPIFKEKNVACFNWGLVAGRTQTLYSWRERSGSAAEPVLWFHDILRPDGSPFDPSEPALLRELTAQK